MRAANALTVFQILGATIGDDLVNRAIEAVNCSCEGKCMCHHPNKLVAEKVTCDCAAARASEKGE